MLHIFFCFYRILELYKENEMADITMCKGTGCEKKEKCHRYMAVKSPRQSFFASVPLKKDGDCAYFSQITEWEEVRKS
jgi:hypothetical protein